MKKKEINYIEKIIKDTKEIEQLKNKNKELFKKM